MAPLRVLLTKRFFEEDLAYLRARLLPEVELVFPPEYTVEAIAETASPEIGVLLGEVIARPVLERATRLRLIQIPWTGVDRLDFALLREYRVTVCNSHSNAQAVAEYAVGLMMAVVKWIPLHDRRLRQGEWLRPQRGVAGSFHPSDLISRRTVGFLGYGRIAQQIAKLLSGFSVRCLATAASPRMEPPSPLEALYGPEGRESVFAAADVLFVTVPLTAETRGMIDAKLLGRMRPTSYLVSVARGEIIEEKALYEALKSEQIAGAAIDTWYDYPTADRPVVLPSTRYPFHELENLVLSPHRAGFARGELPHLDDVIENLNRLARGKPVINVIDLEKGY